MSPTSVTPPTPLRVARAIALVQGTVAALSVLLMLGVAMLAAGGLKNGAFVAFALLFLAGDVLAVSVAVIMAGRRLADGAGWARLLLDVFEGVTIAAGLTAIPLGWSPVGAVMIAAGAAVILCLHLPPSNAVFAAAALLPAPEELEEPLLPVPSLPARPLPAWPRPDGSRRLTSPGRAAVTGAPAPSVPPPPSSRPAPAPPALPRPGRAAPGTPFAVPAPPVARRSFGPATTPAASAGPAAVPAPPLRTAQPPAGTPPAGAPPAAPPAATPRWSPGHPAPLWVASSAASPSPPSVEPRPHGTALRATPGPAPATPPASRPSPSPASPAPAVTRPSPAPPLPVAGPAPAESPAPALPPPAARPASREQPMAPTVPSRDPRPSAEQPRPAPTPVRPSPEDPPAPALPSPAAGAWPQRRPSPAAQPAPLRPMIPPRPPRAARRRSAAPGLAAAVSATAAVPRRVRAAAASAQASLERALPVAPTWGWRRVVVGASVLGAVAGGAASAVGLLTEGPQLPSTGASPLMPPPAPGAAAHNAPAPPPAAPPVERIEPASAGGVAGVAIQPVWCGAGGGCMVTVRVDLQPPHPDEMVSWILVVTDRCSPQRVQTVVPGVPASSSYRFVLSTNQVVIPAWRAPELVAITTSPAHAESAPVAVGGTGSC